MRIYGQSREVFYVAIYHCRTDVTNAVELGRIAYDQYAHKYEEQVDHSAQQRLESEENECEEQRQKHKDKLECAQKCEQVKESRSETDEQRNVIELKYAKCELICLMLFQLVALVLIAFEQVRVIVEIVVVIGIFLVEQLGLLVLQLFQIVQLVDGVLFVY